MQQQYQCPNCGATIVFGNRFCGNCWVQLNWPTQQQLQPSPVKKRGVGQWVKNHKFWSSVIILFVLVEVLTIFNIINPAGAGEILGAYIFFGGLIWSKDFQLRGQE